MFEEFDARTQTKIVRDANGVARVLSHADRYVACQAPTPQLAAHDYLSRYGRLLGLRQQHLRNLYAPVGQEPAAADVEYRFLIEKRQSDLTTVVLHQTCFGLPVWEAGISVTMKHDPLRVVGARSTLHANAEGEAAVSKAYREREAARRRNLGQEPRSRRQSAPWRATRHHQSTLHDLST